MKKKQKSAKQTLYRRPDLRTKHKLVIYFVVFAIFLVLIGKSFFVENNNFFLYFYGVSVTFVLLINFYVAIFKYEDPAVIAKFIEEEKIKNGEKIRLPSVSCIVAVFNEEKAIEQCILSLIRQSYTNKEVIFVNDGSTDGTAKILDKYAKLGKIKVIHQKNAGKKRALGRAMRKARGEIFAFSDSDSTWDVDAIKKVVRVFNVFPEVGGVSGHFRLKNSADNILTKAQDSWADGQFAIRKAFESYFGCVSCVSGPLAIFRREAIYNFVPAWEQDSFLGQEFKFATDRTLTGFLLGSQYQGKRIKRKYANEDCVKKINYPEKDWKVVYCKSAKSWTILPNNLKSLTKQQVRWKKSFIRNTFFTGKFYWRKPVLPAIVYYLHILFVVTGPFIAFRHMIYLPLRGDIRSALLYVSGIIFIGLMFGLAYKLENKDSSLWIYRPVMSLLSTLFLSWLIFYSALTIRKMVWYRG